LGIVGYHHGIPWYPGASLAVYYWNQH